MTSLNELVGKLRELRTIKVRVDWLSLAKTIPSNLPCTRHPLGFLHIELTSIASLYDGERLRLHYWPKSGSNADEIGSLHDHVWSLASAVAAGGLRDRTYQPVPASSGEFIGTRVFYGASRNEFSKEGTLDLSFERELTIGPDEIYRIPSRVVHDTEIVDAPAVTFVFSKDDPDASERGPLILQPHGHADSGTEVREPYDCGKALSLVEERLAARPRPGIVDQSGDVVDA